MKKKIIIICLLVASLFLIGIGVFFLSDDKNLEPNENLPSTPTPSFDLPIEVTNDTGYEVTTNPIAAGNAVGLLIKSTEDENQMLKITANLLNENGEMVSNSEVYAPILGQSYYATEVSFVNADGDLLDVASVQLTISKEGNYYTGLTSDSFELVYDNHVQEKVLKTSLSLTYQGDVPIGDVSGSVVVLKDQKIVSLTSFTQRNVEAGVSTNVTVPDIDFSGVEDIETTYDTILVFVNSLGFLSE